MELFESLGGQLMTQTRAKRLVTDETGAVTGVVCEDAEGETFTIKAGGVVLATGGWQNDTELKTRYLGPEGAQTTVMGTPYNTGSGLKMATPACSLIADETKLLDIITSDEVGGAYFSTDTIEDLADQLNAAGPATYKVHKANLVKTIEEYNAAAETGTGDDLFPPKSGSTNCTPIVEPPFYAVPMRAAIYANYGGVAIDTNAQVLDISRKPIPGLYATVPCAGGVFHEFYTGTIAGAGVTGRLAADAAAKAILG